MQPRTTQTVQAQDIPKKKHATLLDVRKLDDQESLFICTMESNSRKIMDGDIKTINPLVLGSVEDEWTFSTLSFMKDKLRNRLQTHLPLVVSMHGQIFYDINTFPYEEAYTKWKKSVRLTDDI
jgi:hypothetical protein